MSLQTITQQDRHRLVGGGTHNTTTNQPTSQVIQLSHKHSFTPTKIDVPFIAIPQAHPPYTHLPHRKTLGKHYMCVF